MYFNIVLPVLLFLAGFASFITIVTDEMELVPVKSKNQSRPKG